MTEKYVKVSEIPELEKLSFSELQPGKCYLVTIPSTYSMQQVEDLSKGVQEIIKQLDIGVRLLIAPDTMKFYNIGAPTE